MPLTRISIPRHLPTDRAKALAAAVQASLVKTCRVPVDDEFMLITRFDEGDMILNPTFGGMSRTKDASIVEIIFLKGRTDDEKRALYISVNRLAVAAGFQPDDIMLALSENDMIDWSVGRGKAYGG
jgi:phenylpyruvate tautomerase PptA (4-oxalocrotonate tautomerase family)